MHASSIISWHLDCRSSPHEVKFIIMITKTVLCLPVRDCPIGNKRTFQCRWYYNFQNSLFEICYTSSLSNGIELTSGFWPGGQPYRRQASLEDYRTIGNDVVTSFHRIAVPSCLPTKKKKEKNYRRQASVEVRRTVLNDLVTSFYSIALQLSPEKQQQQQQRKT